MPGWDLPTSSAVIFPKGDSDQLENEDNYYVWSVCMRNAFESCDMWDVVNGTETVPTDTTTAEYKIWKKKDNLGKAMITQCIKSDLGIKVAHAKTSTESWNMFASEYSQTDSGSIMLWFRRLTKQLSPGSDVSAHVTGFQEAIRYLANAEFEIPGYIAAAILLSTLPSDPQDPQSWNNHVASVKIDKRTTTLSSVVNGILEEKRRLTEDDKTGAQKEENALAALENAAHSRGKKYCRYHKSEGHDTQDCYTYGSNKKGRSDSSKKRITGRRKKGKEKAHTTHTVDEEKLFKMKSFVVNHEESWKKSVPAICRYTPCRDICLITMFDFAKIERGVGCFGCADPSLFLTPDALHAWHKFFFDYPLQWVINIMGGNELDRRMAALQPRVGVRHWKQGISKLKQCTGREHRKLQKIIDLWLSSLAPS